MFLGPKGNQNEYSVMEKFSPYKTSRDQVKYVEDKMFSLELSSHMKRVSILESNIQKVYCLVIGEVTDLMTKKMESSINWDNIKFIRMYFYYSKKLNLFASNLRITNKRH